jgi:hypothetical protein
LVTIAMGKMGSKVVRRVTESGAQWSSRVIAPTQSQSVRCRPWAAAVSDMPKALLPKDAACAARQHP